MKYLGQSTNRLAKLRQLTADYNGALDTSIELQQKYRRESRWVKARREQVRQDKLANYATHFSNLDRKLNNPTHKDVLPCAGYTGLINDEMQTFEMVGDQTFIMHAEALASKRRYTVESLRQKIVEQLGYPCRLENSMIVVKGILTPKQRTAIATIM